MLGLGAGHLVAAYVDPGASPVLAVGGAVIDFTPLWLKEWAVATLGTADKPVLVAGVVLLVLALGGLAGVLQARTGRGSWLLVALAGIAALAAITRPATGSYAVLPALLASVTALAALRVPRRPAPTQLPAAVHDDIPPAAVTDPGAERRTVLLAAGTTAAGAGLAYLGVRVNAPATSDAATLVLPRPASPLPSLPAGLERSVPGLTPLRTPVADFYRIDTALGIPRVDAATWRLRIDGDVEHPYELSFAELVRLPMIEADITLNCVSNPVGGEYVGSTRWLGVPTRELLARAGVRPGVEQLLCTSQDGMTISTPLAALTDDRGAMLAVAMDGKPLPRRHGYPVRMITPGLYGYVGATKWLTRMTATTYADSKAYWSTRGWAEQAPVKTQSRIDVPRSSEQFSAGGEVVIAGVAWSQAHHGISRVEVQVDDGDWHEADLGPDVGGHYWRQWRWTWRATAGEHRITVRATDGESTRQTTTVAEPAPDGASGLHTIEISVS